jgi:hypothetical protein
MRRRTAVYAIALVGLAIVSRLPQLRSPNLLLDGDECVLGLMARHAMHGEVPIFFWGQHYGLSTIEAYTGAFAFALFGVGALQLKIAMLGLWTMGVLFLFLAQSAFVGARRSFWITAVFVANPAWAAWSMKARGGYLTAFMAASMLLWLLVRPRERETIVRWLAAGALTAITYLAQPLFLVGILPVVIASMITSRRRLSSIATYVGVAAAFVLALERISVPNSTAWTAPALWNPRIAATMAAVVQQIYINMTGSYYLRWAIDPPGIATIVEAITWCALLIVVVVTQVYRLATRRFLWWSHVLFLGAVATIIANWILLFARDARYMLPLSPLLVMVVGVEFVDLLDRGIVPIKVVRAVTAGALLLGAVSLWEFRGFNFLWENPPNRLSESKRLEQVVNSITSRGVYHVFSMNGLLDTQIIFYSDERVISRWSSADDRHSEYVAEVNRALAEGEPIAVVGYTNASGAPGCWDVPICTGGLEGMVERPETIFTVDNKYFVYVGADKQLLRQLHFDLRE